LVIGAVAYALLAIGSIVLIGRQFVSASETKNHTEADYRYVLTRLRENGESIALIGGEDEERAGVDRSLNKVLSAWRDICFQYMKTTIVSQSSGYIAAVLPIILCAPKYLDGSLTLGQVMQAASAFTIVQAAFNWLVDNYPRLADWTASARRVASLMVSLDALEAAESGDTVSRIEIAEGSSEAALRLVNLSVTLDDGTGVLDDAEVSIMPGERVLIAGESGTGKSTLVRAIAGLWPWGEGKIEYDGARRCFSCRSVHTYRLARCAAPLHILTQSKARRHARLPTRYVRSALIIWSNVSTKKGHGTRRYQVARSSALPLRVYFFKARISLSWMRRLQHSILKVRTSSWTSSSGSRPGRR
jgi:putative ATP-binding cassette transporter